VAEPQHAYGEGGLTPEGVAAAQDAVRRMESGEFDDAALARAVAAASEPEPHDASGEPCVGDTYLSWGRDGDPDSPFVTKVECDGGPLGDCGFLHVIEEGDWSGGINHHEMAGYHAAHLAHRAERASREGGEPRG
jgi:hypothetical protein